MQDSDCDKYNVANPLRFASPNGCSSTGLTWERELCDRATNEQTCDNNQGCDAFKASLKLSDLPRSLRFATFSGQHYAGVTGDLTDLAGMEWLETLALPSSTEITGDLATLSTLATAVAPIPRSLTRLAHLDLGASNHIHGDITNLLAATRYVNLGSAEGLEGDVADLKAGLEYGNFRSARWIVGELHNAGGAGCSLRELNLHNARPGPALLRGLIADNVVGAVTTNGILTNCGSLRWLDVGRAFGTANLANEVVPGTQWTTAFARTVRTCIHTGSGRTAHSSQACRNGSP